MSNSHLNEARSTNFLFTVGANRQVTYAVQSSNINDLTMGFAPFMTGAKDLKIPTNKVENGPLTIDIIVSEDYSEWVEMFKWLMLCKNTNDAHLTQTKTCTLTALTSQNQPSTQFVYGDAFPTEVTGISLASNDTGSNVITTSVVFQFNTFKVILPNGEMIDEQYIG